MDTTLLAPCGMNCSICLGFQRERNVCKGCRNNEGQKTKTRLNCIIKNCTYFQETDSLFCYDCPKYPCARLKQLDKRYRTKYHMSMMENLGNIKLLGKEKFMESENERWKCPECGGLTCVHRGYCLQCERRRAES